MSDELKPRESVDTPEFRDLLKDVCDKPYRADRVVALIAHINAWGARLADEAVKDAERLDRLEVLGNEPEGLLLHDGSPGTATGRRVLGLGKLGRSLREAVDAIASPTPDKEPPCGS